MEAIDYFSWFVLIVILLSVVFVFVSLAQLPGKMARARSHPHADAVDMAGWLGMLLTLGVSLAQLKVGGLGRASVLAMLRLGMGFAVGLGLGGGGAAGGLGVGEV